MKRPAVKSKQPAATPAVATRKLPIRRWVTIGVVVCAVLGAAGAVGAVVRSNGAKAFAAPTLAAGPGSFAVPMKGSPAVTLTLFEDMRDPATVAFDTTYGPTLSSLIDSGTVTVLYRQVAGVDAAHGGSGSLRAGNALGCAQDAGYFSKYRKVLLKNQPAESDDTFASTGELVTLAKKVKHLNSDVFRACLDSGAHNVWVKDSTADFTAADLGSVPVLQMQVKGQSGSTTMVGNGQQSTPKQLMADVLAAAVRTPTAEASPSAP